MFEFLFSKGRNERGSLGLITKVVLVTLVIEGVFFQAKEERIFDVNRYRCW